MYVVYVIIITCCVCVCNYVRCVYVCNYVRCVCDYYNLLCVCVCVIMYVVYVSIITCCVCVCVCVNMYVGCVCVIMYVGCVSIFFNHTHTHAYMQYCWIELVTMMSFKFESAVYASYVIYDAMGSLASIPYLFQLWAKDAPSFHEDMHFLLSFPFKHNESFV